jgi:hypothetical protein
MARRVTRQRLLYVIPHKMATQHQQPCGDCGCQPGELHDPFCTKEECPFCHGQLVSCRCIIRELKLDDEERTAVEEFIDDSVEPLRSIVERWREALDSKGRIAW